MPAPVQKLDIPSYVLDQGVAPIEDFLVANGWAAGTDRTHNLACACWKLGAVDSLHGVVKIHIEYNPGHYLVIVDTL
jgi:hypothetical protein